MDQDANSANALPPPEVFKVHTLQVACDGSGEVAPALGHPRVLLRIEPDIGFGLRGAAGETTAFSHANEISAAAIDRAAATLKLLDPAKGQPAPPPARTNQAMYTSDDPLSAIPFADKVALCQTIDAAAPARD